jgi:crossover junction endodeoxyribonuclease RuvC
MLVIGIDPGLTTTGFGAIRKAGSRVDVIAAGVIRTDKDLPTSSRLESLYVDITELIEDVRPGVMAVERVFMNRNRMTATRVGQASGVVMLAASLAGIEVFEYSPSAVKAIVTGDGSASKVQVQQMVARRLGLASVPSPADTADALAVALCHMQSMGNLVGRLTAAHGGGR